MTHVDRFLHRSGELDPRKDVSDACPHASVSHAVAFEPDIADASVSVEHEVCPDGSPHRACTTGCTPSALLELVAVSFQDQAPFMKVRRLEKLQHPEVVERQCSKATSCTVPDDEVEVREPGPPGTQEYLGDQLRIRAIVDPKGNPAGKQLAGMHRLPCFPPGNEGVVQPSEVLSRRPPLLPVWQPRRRHRAGSARVSLQRSACPIGSCLR